MKRRLMAALFSVVCGWGSVTYTVTAIQPSDSNGNLWLGGLSGNGQFAVTNTSFAGYLYDGGGQTSTFTIAGIAPMVQVVNNSGTVAGYYDSGGGPYGHRAFSISAAGTVNFLPNPINAVAPSYAMGIDNVGNIAGTVITTADPYSSNRANVWLADGSSIDVTSQIPGALWTTTAAMANNGYMIGNHQGGSFLYNFLTGQTVSSIPGNAMGVSDNGNVAGYSGGVATLYSAGSNTIIGSTNPGHMSEAYGVNSAGTVVGQAATPGNFWRAFVYSGGVMSDLNSLLTTNLDGLLGGNGWYLSSAEAISNTGVVLARAVGGGPVGLNYAVLLTPQGEETPEPATYLLMGAGLGCLYLRFRSQRGM